MSRMVGFNCKTSGCEAFLVLREIPDDTARAVYNPINLGPDPVALTCPDCRQTHDYSWSEKVIAKQTAP